MDLPVFYISLYNANPFLIWLKDTNIVIYRNLDAKNRFQMKAAPTNKNWTESFEINHSNSNCRKIIKRS